MHELDHELNEMARSRGQLLTRGHVLDAGGTDQIIADRVARGQWLPVHPGVVLVGIGPLSWEQRVQAATLAAGDGAVASHRSALLLWGLDGISAAPVEITVPYGQRPLPAEVVVHRSRRLEPASLRAGILITSVERTLLEVGAVAPAVVVEKAFASALRQGLTTVAKTALYLEHNGGRGRTGTRRLREVVALYDDGQRAPGSAAEVELLRELRRSGIEAPVRQYPVDLADGSKAVVDFAWPARRKAVELEGWHHHSDSRAHDYDSWRDNLVREAGWDVRRFAPYSLRHRPMAVSMAILRFLCT